MYENALLVPEGVNEDKYHAERQRLFFNVQLSGSTDENADEINAILSSERWIYVFLKPVDLNNGSTSPLIPIYKVDDVDTQTIVLCAPLSRRWTFGNETIPWNVDTLNDVLNGNGVAENSLRPYILNIKLSPYPPFAQSAFKYLSYDGETDTVNVPVLNADAFLRIDTTMDSAVAAFSVDTGSASWVSLNNAEIVATPQGFQIACRLSMRMATGSARSMTRNFSLTGATVGSDGNLTVVGEFTSRDFGFAVSPAFGLPLITVGMTLRTSGFRFYGVGVELSGNTWLDRNGNNIPLFNIADHGITWQFREDTISSIVPAEDSGEEERETVGITGTNAVYILSSNRTFNFPIELIPASRKTEGMEFEEIRITDHLGDYIAFDRLRIGYTSSVFVYDELMAENTNTVITLATNSGFYAFNTANYKAIVQNTDTGLPIYISAMDEFFATRKNWESRNELERQTARQMLREQQRNRWLGVGVGAASGAILGRGTGAAFGAIGGAIGAGVSNITAQRSLNIQQNKSIQMERKTLEDLEASPPTLNGNANVLVNMRVSGLLPHVDIYRVEPHVITAWENYFDLYGYKYGMVDEVMIQEGFIQANIESIQTLGISERERVDLAERFASGIRFIKPYTIGPQILHDGSRK